ncbi:MAG: DUF4445 domain-containing protein [Spirochaetes bacterium]|nr:DUF4445 domain-containing protein [Spirochaetota bacterium]
MWKRFKIDIIGSGQTLSVKENSNLFKELQRNRISLNSTCNGKEECGKCVVQITAGTPPAVSSDQKHLSKSQILNNYRLACSCNIQSDMTLSIPDNSITEQGSANTADNIITTRPDHLIYTIDPVIDPGRILKKQSKGSRLFGIAVDIGTTTLVLSLIDMVSGDTLSTVSKIDPLVQYGADLISRITHSISGKKNIKIMQKELLVAINSMIRESAEKNGVDPSDIQMATFSSNSVMNHILMGLSLVSFSKAPYSFVTQSFKLISKNRLNLKMNSNAMTYIIPNISGFIGGDIISDMITASLNTKKIELLIDIGTNGEIVLNKNGELFCTSTAAGPAFEGGKIKFGMIAGPGAVFSAEMNGGKIRLNVIGEGVPKGICGTGLIDLLSILVRKNCITKDGRINKKKEEVFRIDEEPVIDIYNKEIYITQKDIREFQLAKGAIKAGIMILLNDNGISEEQIDTVYVSGAFGNYLNIENSIELNFLPDIDIKRFKFIGNGSLTGAYHALLNKSVIQEMEELSKRITFIELASRPEFQDIFIDSLNF